MSDTDHDTLDHDVNNSSQPVHDCQGSNLLTMDNLDLENQDSCETMVVLQEESTPQHLLNKKCKCQKNPGHQMFKSVRAFVMGDLPEPYRNPMVFSYLQTLCEATVRVKTSYISTARPQGYHNYKLGGVRCTCYGSGFVEKVYQAFDDPMTCPCRSCVASSKPETKWWRVRIATANHVVFDSKEAASAVVDLFSDDEIDVESGVKQIQGYKVIISNQEQDWCLFDCVTHDTQLVDRLKALLEQLADQGRKMNKQHKNTEDKMAVVVSHPHGCAKLISLGQWVGKRWIYIWSNDSESCSFDYTTATCPGSSGGPVRIWGVKGFSGHSHPHKKGPDRDGVCKYNQSACSWEERS